RDANLTMEELGDVTLKGITDPPRVFLVRLPRGQRWQAETATVASIAAAPPGARQILCPEVVGRDRELAALEAHLATAIGGTGSTVLLAGEAGLGKSALLRRFLERAGSSARVLQ